MTKYLANIKIKSYFYARNWSMILKHILHIILDYVVNLILMQVFIIKEISETLLLT